MPTNPTLITTNHLRAFLVHLGTEVTKGQNHPLKSITNKPLSPFTVAAYARTLKAFFSWAEREGYLEQNPARLLKVPKVPCKVVQTLAQDQIRRLLAAVDLTRPNGFRDRCKFCSFLTPLCEFQSWPIWRPSRRIFKGGIEGDGQGLERVSGEGILFREGVEILTPLVLNGLLSGSRVVANLRDRKELCAETHFTLKSRRGFYRMLYTEKQEGIIETVHTEKQMRIYDRYPILLNSGKEFPLLTSRSLTDHALFK